MQERILGHLDQVQDILALGSASRATQAALAHASWTGVQCLRCVGLAQSPLTLDNDIAVVFQALQQRSLPPSRRTNRILKEAMSHSYKSVS